MRMESKAETDTSSCGLLANAYANVSVILVCSLYFSNFKSGLWVWYGSHSILKVEQLIELDIDHILESNDVFFLL
jgi:hypothetical protein